MSMARVDERERSRALVNAALDQYKNASGKTWDELAAEFGVDQATLHRWRSGDLGKAARVLVQIVAESQRASSV